jgi:ribonuclease Z
MKYNLSILGVPNGEMTPSLALQMNDQTYLFNVGEGTQRFCIEHKVRLIKVRNIFFSGISWDHIGGLPGN